VANTGDVTVINKVVAQISISLDKYWSSCSRIYINSFKVFFGIIGSIVLSPFELSILNRPSGKVVRTADGIEKGSG
jgi:hypothetical protein